MSVFFTRRGKAPATIDAIFANNSWEAIVASCQSGRVPDSWSVGDSKMMTINGTDYQIDIIGKNGPLGMAFAFTFNPNKGVTRCT